mmetsp:Transcript_99840/g.223795  ORF Transcript_99840/g.223795 Transcript_99840/m.223795 type:complete len:248 (-) Transcript_99840:370-1113(-)
MPTASSRSRSTASSGPICSATPCTSAARTRCRSPCGRTPATSSAGWTASSRPPQAATRPTSSRTRMAPAGTAASTATATARGGTRGLWADRCRHSWPGSPWSPTVGCRSASRATSRRPPALASRARRLTRPSMLGASTPSWPWLARSAAMTPTAPPGPPRTTALPSSSTARSSRSPRRASARAPPAAGGARGAIGLAWATWAGTGTPRLQRASARQGSRWASPAARGARSSPCTRTPVASTAGSTRL